MQGTGIGPALRKARLLRGKSIEEASRETRIRAEYLSALERERFDSLLGQVYVRGFLRSYSSYLGLDSDKVLTVYNRRFGFPQPTLPRAPEAPARSPKVHPVHLPSLRGHHLSWPVLLAVAALIVAVLAASGLFSRSKTAPPPAAIPPQGVVGAPPANVVVGILASVAVHATIAEDGRVVFDRVLRAGEGQSFEADRSIQVQLDRGASAVITVNGQTLGSAGSSREPYSATFGPRAFRSEPSPGPSSHR